MVHINIFRKVLVVLVSVMLTSCMNPQAIVNNSVSDAQSSDPINVIAASCESLGITRDCSTINGAERKIVLEGIPMKVSANDEGTIIFTMNDSSECALGDNGCITLANNRNYRALKRNFEKAGISILSVSPVGMMDVVAGYLIKLDSDGYSLVTK